MPAKKGWKPPFNRARHEQSGQYRMWQAMRVHRTFTYRDITSLEIASFNTVKSYCTALVAAGYLRRTGKHGQPQTYVLVRDTGPFAPQVRRDGRVEDLNLNSKREGA